MSAKPDNNEIDIENISNADLKAKWGLPDDIDPYKVDLEKINPANNDWFGKNLDAYDFIHLQHEPFSSCMNMFVYFPHVQNMFGRMSKCIQILSRPTDLSRTKTNFA